MPGFSVCLDYAESVPEDTAAEVMDRLAEYHTIPGWDPDTQNLSLRMTVDTTTIGGAVSLAEILAADVLSTVWGRVPALVAVLAMTEEEQVRRLAL